MSYSDDNKKAHEAVMDHVRKMSSEQLIESLKKVGILNENGKLTQKYGGEEEDMKIVIYQCDWCGDKIKEDIDGGLPLGWRYLPGELICGICNEKQNNAKMKAFEKIRDERKKFKKK